LARFLARRTLAALPTLIGVATVVFFLLRLIPGDPARVIAGETATDAQVERIRENLGLNQPLFTQYALFMLNLARLDLGESSVTGHPVLQDIMARLPATIALTLAAMTIGLTVGLTLGILAARFRGTWIDVGVSFLAVSGMSLPTYWLGLTLVVIFAIVLRWFPASGFQGPSSLVLPALTLSTLTIAVIARMTRSAMLEVLNQDYIRTARAKGASPGRIIFRHALPNAIPPILTVAGIQFGLMLGGAVLTETVFTWPGMGRLLVDSIFARDYAVVQGAVLLFSIGFILVNVVVDILYGVADPRIRAGSSS
jgi:ABC-type dipeptide/oligopeptide/nickel transport system permease component